MKKYIVILGLAALGCSADPNNETTAAAAGGGAAAGGSSGGSGGVGGMGTGGMGGTGGSSGGEHLWSHRFGDAPTSQGGAGGGMGVAAGADIPQHIATYGNNVIVAGTFVGTLDFGGTPLESTPPLVPSPAREDMFMVALDPSGTPVWTKQLGNFGVEAPLAMAVDAGGNIIVAGTFEQTVDFGGGAFTSSGFPNRDTFIAKYDDTGAHVWSKQLDQVASSDSLELTITGTDDVLIVGSFEPSVDFGGGPVSNGTLDVVVAAKLDGDGNHLWSKPLVTPSVAGPTPPGFAMARSIAVDGSGNIAITGAFHDTVDFGGGDVFGDAFGFLFLAKYDADGAYLWEKTAGSMINSSTGHDVTTDANGNVILVGVISETIDLGGGAFTTDAHHQVTKYSPAGDELWTTPIGEDDLDADRLHLAQAPSGNLILTGSFQGTLTLGGVQLDSIARDLFVASIDADGNHLWSRQSTNDGNATFPYGIGVDSAGNTLITGSFATTVDLGGDVLSSEGAEDIFVAKYGP